MKYSTIINGVDISEFIENDSYKTSVSNIMSRTITTIGGVDYAAKLRERYTVRFKLRAISAENLAMVSALILDAPIEFYGRILQKNANVSAMMIPDAITSQYLSEFVYGGIDWNNSEEIVLTSMGR